ALLAALMVTYRDFGHIVQFMVQMWFFATPAIFGIEPASTAARCVYALNPAQGLIANFRAALLGDPFQFSFEALAISAVISLSLLFVGCLYFKRVERTFADLV